jgi:hypothetical protein
MAHASLICPSCFAALKPPGNVPDGAFLKCPKCAARFRRASAPAAAPAPAADFWEKARLNDLAEAPSPAAAPAPPAIEPATPAAPPGPRPRRMAPVAIGVGAACLLLGAAAALVGTHMLGERPQAVTETTPPVVEPPPPVRDGGRPAETAHVNAAPVAPRDTPSKAEEPPPDAAKAAAPPPAAVPDPPYFAWTQDFDQACRQARQEHKDVLVLFTGSDWCPFCIRLADDCLRHAEFDGWLRERFVPVYVDFPRQPAAQARVRDAARNARLRDERFAKQFQGHPTLVLADSAGRPYGLTSGYGGPPDAVRTELEKMRQDREQRDKLFAAVERAAGADKLSAVREAVVCLRKLDFKYDMALELDRHYGPLLGEWLALARRLDPRNEQGAADWVFGVNWPRRVMRALAAGAEPARLRPLAEEFDRDWGGVRFKDPDWAATLLEWQATLRVKLGDLRAARAALDAALTYGLSAAWRNKFADVPKVLGLREATGLVVAADGIILTSSEAVARAKFLWVRPAGGDDLPAAVAGSDDARGLALLRVTAPPQPPLKALRPVAQSAGRGGDVGAFGYEAGKPARIAGRVTAVRGAAPQFAPGRELPAGYAGGPLFGPDGRLAGLVLPPRRNGPALAAADAVDEFLRQNLGAAPPAAAPPRGWLALDPAVKAALVQILVAP